MLEHHPPHTPALPPIPPSLPRDPNRALEEMGLIIERLTHVYERETDALQKLDTRAFLAEQDEKAEIAEIYQRAIKEIVARKNEMSQAKPELKQRLEAMHENFSALSHKNMRALKRMQKTMERLGNTVRRIAKEETEKQRTFSYSANGELQQCSRKAISTGLSETA